MPGQVLLPGQGIHGITMTQQPFHPELKVLENRMRPGVLSVGGFLGSSENLAEVLERDQKTLTELNLTFEELAEPLNTLIRAAESSTQRKVSVNQYEVAVTVFSGFQICPWSPDPDQGQCRAGSGVQFGHLDWKIRNKNNKMQLQGAGLLVHLIRDHHFFEGRESPYRISPRQLAQLFELRR